MGKQNYTFLLVLPQMLDAWSDYAANSTPDLGWVVAKGSGNN